MAVALPAGLLFAWHSGIFDQAGLRTEAASSPCGAVLRARDAERLGHRQWQLVAVDKGPGQCALEVAPPVGSGANAGLRVEMRAAVSAEDFVHLAAAHGSSRQPLPQLGPEAFRVEADEREVVGLRVNDVALFVLFPAAAYEDEAVEAAIELLSTRREGIVAP